MVIRQLEASAADQTWDEEAIARAIGTIRRDSMQAIAAESTRLDQRIQQYLMMLAVVSGLLCASVAGFLVIVGRQNRRLRGVVASLQQARYEAQQADSAKTQFMANMSHELRTPLNAIIGFADMIRSRAFGDDPERYSDYAADIQYSGLHLLTIISSILDLTKIGSRQYSLTLDDHDLCDLLHGAMRMLQAHRRGGDVRLSCVAHQRIPVTCDGTAITQVILNLASNALKAAHGRGRVAIRCGRRDDCVWIAVRDTGIGMSESELAIAMEPFRQIAGKYGGQFPGTGLGLPLTQELVTLHGGRLILRSRKGRGTLATVLLPAEAQGDAVPETLAAVA